MFNSWLRSETGLSLYDFRVLPVYDLFGYDNSGKEVKELFNQWCESVNPIPAEVTKAIEAAAEFGFDVLD